MQILGFCLVLFFFAGALSDYHTITPKRCEIAYRCSDEEKPVSATRDGVLCEVFRNECILLSRNCSSVNENKPEYRIITQTECQELCRNMVCLAVFQPVCGSYNDKLMTFGNDCEMLRHICTTGETYSLYKGEACPE